MHLAVAVCAAITAWIWGDWRNWQKYYPTLLYVFSVSMLYEFLTKEHTIWQFKPDFLFNHTQVILLHAAISVPLTVFVFLSNYPGKWGKQILWCLMWIGIYITVESLLYLTNRIVYEHKWSLGWSFVFDLIMFPMLRLHFKKPLLADALSVFIIVLYVFLFKVPVE